MKVLASLSILLALLAVSQATAETRSITIGKFTYVGTGTQTRSEAGAHHARVAALYIARLQDLE